MTRIAAGMILVLGMAAVARGQSLAELAKQESARRAGLAQPARVYTNKDARPDGFVAPPPVSITPAAPAPAPALAPALALALAPAPAPALPREDLVEHHHERPIIVINPFPFFPYPYVVRPPGPTVGTNTAREEAMSSFMRSAGFGPQPEAAQKPR